MSLINFLKGIVDLYTKEEEKGTILIDAHPSGFDYFRGLCVWVSSNLITEFLICNITVYFHYTM